MQDPHDQAKASIPTTMETVINGPTRSGKAATRTEPWCLVPLPPQDQDINDIIDLCSDSDDEIAKQKKVTSLLGKKRTYIAMAPAETTKKIAHEEERRMSITRSLGEHSKYVDEVEV
jgi:hypothetical protein